MTAAGTLTRTEDRPIGALARITRVVKLHFANPWPILLTPLMILGFIFVINLIIWWIIRTVAGPADAADAIDGFQYSGSTGFIFVYMMVVAILAMSQTFAFALGFGATRRDYYLGTALTFVTLTAFYTALIGVLAAIERATDGWGLGGRMFTPMYFGPDWAGQLFAVAALFLFFLFLGSLSGAIYVRFKSFGVTLFWCVVALAVVGGAALLTLSNGWIAFGTFFANAGWLGSYAWTLVPTALAAIAGFFVLRRATPRSS
jgi:hypothetical protein